MILKTPISITKICLQVKGNQPTLTTKTKKVLTTHKPISDNKGIMWAIVSLMQDKQWWIVEPVIRINPLTCQQVFKIKAYKELLPTWAQHKTLEWTNNCKISLILIESQSNLNQNTTMLDFQESKVGCFSST